ncbi:MAG: DUF5666 domain-containing protein [Gammaproteobacteria bacterium]
MRTRGLSAAVPLPVLAGGLLLAAALAVSPVTHAGNACENGGAPTPRTLAFGGGSGIGGTGSPHEMRNEGIGGTGSPGQPRNEGIGGTGAPPTAASGGMGGTGAVAEQGIGGTGAPAENGGSGIGGTGIVGTVTGFGSICVNGVEIHYGRNTPLRANGRKGSVHDLAVGQVVSVNAAGTGDQVRARAIRVLNAVAGPIAHFDRKRRRLRILGQTVQLGPRTQFAGQAKGPMGLAPGAYVVVSGLRTDTGVIAATHILRTPPRAAVSIRGPVTARGNGTIHIFGLPVRTNSAPQVNTGQQVQVTGRLVGGQLQAERVQVEPPVPFGGRVQHLDLEGFVGKSGGPGQVQIGSVTVSVNRATQFTKGSAAQLRPNERVWVRARVERADGGERVVAERIQIERERPRTDRHTGTSERRHHRSTGEANQTDHGHANRGGSSDAGSARHAIEHPAHHEHHGAEHHHAAALERPDVQHPEFHRPELERPTIERPEVHRPEVERPEVERPEIERPETERPERD